MATSVHQRWQEIVARYTHPSTLRSIWQIVNSLVPFVAIWVAMVYSLQVGYWLTLLLSILAAGFMVRLFIIFHDCTHGSFFSSTKANTLVGSFIGVLVFTPFEQWQRDHAIHHATAGNLDKRGTGDVMTITVREYLALPWYKKVGYRILRNPLILFTIGSLIDFVILHRLPTKTSGKRELRSVWWTNFFLAALIIILGQTIGWLTLQAVELPILFFACSAGVWMFYVQHNFDGTYWERQKGWDFLKAGMDGSSFYKLPAILNWFTGNIGYHHIHHLAPRIPNYLLPRAYRENPLFHIKPLTIRRSLKSLAYRLWDEDGKKLVSYAVLNKYKNNPA